MAEQLEVARNTVVLAYQQLSDEGYLVSRQRSGHFVHANIIAGRIAGIHSASNTTSAEVARRQLGKIPNWSGRLQLPKITPERRYRSVGRGEMRHLVCGAFTKAGRAVARAT